MPDLAHNQSHLIFVAGTVIKNGKILVGKRSPHEAHEANKWGIPGGKVDKTRGEIEHILESTLAREIFEETGVAINPSTIKYLHSMTFIRSTGHHVVALHFSCHWQSGRARAGEDTVAVAWVGPSDLDQFEWAKGTKEALLRCFEVMSLV